MKGLLFWIFVACSFYIETEQLRIRNADLIQRLEKAQGQVNLLENRVRFLNGQVVTFGAECDATIATWSGQ